MRYRDHINAEIIPCNFGANLLGQIIADAWDLSDACNLSIPSPPQIGSKFGMCNLEG